MCSALKHYYHRSSAQTPLTFPIPCESSLGFNVPYGHLQASTDCYGAFMRKSIWLSACRWFSTCLTRPKGKTHVAPPFSAPRLFRVMKRLAKPTIIRQTPTCSCPLHDRPALPSCLPNRG